MSAKHTTDRLFTVPSREYPTVRDALNAAAVAGSGTVCVAAGVYREPTTLLLAHGVSLVGAGPRTVLESEGTVLVCEGALLLADLAVRQVCSSTPAVCCLRKPLPRIPGVGSAGGRRGLERDARSGAARRRDEGGAVSD